MAGVFFVVAVLFAIGSTGIFYACSPVREVPREVAPHAVSAQQNNPIWPTRDTIVFGDGRVIYTVDSKGSTLEPLNEQLMNRRFGIELSPSISPDGSRIAYGTNRYESGPFWQRNRDFEIVVSRLDGREVRRLEKGWNPSWSGDGQQIAYWQWDGIYVVSVDELDARRVAITPPNVAPPPVWSPNKKYIAFACYFLDFPFVPITSRTLVVPGHHCRPRYIHNCEGGGLSCTLHTYSTSVVSGWETACLRCG